MGFFSRKNTPALFAEQVRVAMDAARNASWVGTAREKAGGHILDVLDSGAADSNLALALDALQCAISYAPSKRCEKTAAKLSENVLTAAFGGADPDLTTTLAALDKVLSAQSAALKTHYEKMAAKLFDALDAQAEADGGAYPGWAATIAALSQVFAWHTRHPDFKARCERSATKFLDFLDVLAGDFSSTAPGLAATATALNQVLDLSAQNPNFKARCERIAAKFLNSLDTMAGAASGGTDSDLAVTVAALNQIFSRTAQNPDIKARCEKIAANFFDSLDAPFISGRSAKALDTALRTSDQQGFKDFLATRMTLRLLKIPDLTTLANAADIMDYLGVVACNVAAHKTGALEQMAVKIWARTLDVIAAADKGAACLAAAGAVSKIPADGAFAKQVAASLLNLSGEAPDDKKLPREPYFTTPATAAKILDYIGPVACNGKSGALQPVAVTVWGRALDVIAAADKDAAYAIVAAAVPRAPADSAFAKQVAASLLKLSESTSGKKSGDQTRDVTGPPLPLARAVVPSLPNSPQLPDKKLPGPN